MWWVSGTYWLYRLRCKLLVLILLTFKLLSRSNSWKFLRHCLRQTAIRVTCFRTVGMWRKGRIPKPWDGPLEVCNQGQSCLPSTFCDPSGFLPIALQMTSKSPFYDRLFFPTTLAAPCAHALFSLSPFNRATCWIPQYLLQIYFMRYRRNEWPQDAIIRKDSLTGTLSVRRKGFRPKRIPFETLTESQAF